MNNFEQLDQDVKDAELALADYEADLKHAQLAVSQGKVYLAELIIKREKERAQFVAEMNALAQNPH